MMWKFAVLLLCVPLLTAFPAPSKRYVGDTTLKLTRASRGLDLHPAELDIELRTQDNDKVELRLKRNDNINTGAQMYVGHEGTISALKQTKRENFAAYVDTDSMASFLVRSELDDSGKYKRTFHGRFQRGNMDWSVEQTDKSANDKRNADQQEVDEDDTLLKRIYSMLFGEDVSANGKRNEKAAEEEEEEVYSLFVRDPDELEWEKDVRYPPGEGPEQQMIDLTAQALSNVGGDKTVYTVEFMFFLDYSIFDMQSRMPGATTESAMDSIRWGYSQVANGMDMRYRSIDAADFEINVSLVGFYIAKTPDMSPWTYDRNIRIQGRDVDYADVYKALDKFEEWIGEHESEFDPFDQATAFSRMKLFSGTKADGSRRTISGLADVRGVCTGLRCSINHENGDYGSIQTGAHEMGHNLGADHDGNKNRCSNKDQYVMASAPASLNEDTYDKALTFSSCSIQYFRDHLNKLTMDGTNCLLNGASDKNKAQFEQAMSVLPGQKISLDDQCKYVVGKTSYYCAGKADATIGSLMMCYNPEKYKCMTITEVRAFDGTTCGNKKWCTGEGRCEESDNAPAAAETCLYGDFKGKFGDGSTCESAIRSNPRLCYTDRAEDCCETCANIRDDSKPGCEFGDHDSFCSTTKKEDCYTEDVSNSCCKKCADFNTNEPGCEFGDKASWCRNAKASQCYVDGETCCDTCKRFNTGIEDCEYGDKASWCSSVQRGSCYTDEKSCCGSCNRLKSGPDSCPYGDKDKYCRREDCSDSYYWTSCCQTCASEIAAGGR